MKPGRPESGRKPAEPRPPREEREDFGDQVQAHVRYYVGEGANRRRVPGVTTVLGVLNKEYLVRWANDLGLDGIDAQAYTDATAQVGKLAHKLVERELDGGQEDLTKWSADQQERAAHSVRAFRNWRGSKILTPQLVEVPLVSEEFGYGGTIDYYGGIDGIDGLLDHKTSKFIGLGHKIQATAYKKLLIEHGRVVKWVKVLRLGRTERTLVAEEQELEPDNMKLYWQIFLDCLHIYKLKKELGER